VSALTSLDSGLRRNDEQKKQRPLRIRAER